MWIRGNGKPTTALAVGKVSVPRGLFLQATIVAVTAVRAARALAVVRGAVTAIVNVEQPLTAVPIQNPVLVVTPVSTAILGIILSVTMIEAVLVLNVIVPLGLRNNKLVKPMVRKHAPVRVTARVLGEVGVRVLVRQAVLRTEPAIRQVVRRTIPVVLPIRGTRAPALMMSKILVWRKLVRLLKGRKTIQSLAATAVRAV